MTAVMGALPASLRLGLTTVLSPRLLCCGLLAVILSWTSLAADAAAAVVSVCVFACVCGAGRALTRTS